MLRCPRRAAAYPADPVDHGDHYCRIAAPGAVQLDPLAADGLGDYLRFAGLNRVDAAGGAGGMSFGVAPKATAARGGDAGACRYF